MMMAQRIKIRGVVQGVGFRPFVYRVARQLQVHGWVQNDGQGVTIHAEAPPEVLLRFTQALQQDAPPAATISQCLTEDVPPEGWARFEIRGSHQRTEPTAPVSVDLPLCDACRVEMLDPNSSRHLYPYINCTACGPRYSIVTALPYDRARTTMAAWPLCPACQAEYDDPADRRHHAQPTACNQCGPTFRLVVERQTAATGVGAIQQAAERLGAGEIVAIKGIGGYHVACDARNVDAVERLRTRKFRKEKPFAVLARDLEQASALVELSDLDQALLQSIARPIVLAPARQRLPGVADGTDQLGVMLPYAPVQELLLHFDAPTPLVLTSGNRSNEPIAITDEDTEERLQEIVDAFLIGERPIQRRVDDSVVTVESGSTTVIRRARGYAPAVVAEWADRGRPLLALGADLKNTITLVVEGHAFMSPHIGDLGDLETNRAFEQAVHDFLKMYHVEPHELDVVHDAHPDYVSTQFAKNLACHQRMAIQHHRAHVAAVLAEHRQLDQEVLGFALDGTGYGDDGTIWGFEVFRGSVRAGFERVAHPRPIRLPGGDAAARFPDQAAAGYLAGLEDELTEGLSLSQRFRTALPLARRGIRCHRTTSAGRLFDAAAAVCGFAGENTYEGQAAIWLEQLAMAGADTSIEYDFSELDPEGLLRPMVVDRLRGTQPAEIAFAFHAAMAAAIGSCHRRLASTLPVAVAGGVFQNRLLMRLVRAELPVPLFTAGAIPTNDGGISLGQAALVHGTGSV